MSKDNRDPEKIGLAILNVKNRRQCSIVEAADVVMEASALAKYDNVLHGDQNGKSDATH